jgi:hypothetical protein
MLVFLLIAILVWFVKPIYSVPSGIDLLCAC